MSGDPDQDACGFCGVAFPNLDQLEKHFIRADHEGRSAMLAELREACKQKDRMLMRRAEHIEAMRREIDRLRADLTKAKGDLAGADRAVLAVEQRAESLEKLVAELMAEVAKYKPYYDAYYR